MLQMRPEIKGHVETPVEISGTGWSTEIMADVWYRVEEYHPAVTNAPMDRCRPAEGGGIEVLEIRLRMSNDISEKIKQGIKRSAEAGDLADEIYHDAEDLMFTQKELEAEARMVMQDLRQEVEV